MKKTAKQVLERLMVLCDWINNHKTGRINKSDEELLKFLPQYKDRLALYRDLRRLEAMHYVKIEVSTYTPVSIKNGSAKQFFRKNRIIVFTPSEEGLIRLPTKERFIAPGYIPYAEEKRIEKWMEGPDKTLVRNPEYKGK